MTAPQQLVAISAGSAGKLLNTTGAMLDLSPLTLEAFFNGILSIALPIRLQQLLCGRLHWVERLRNP